MKTSKPLRLGLLIRPYERCRETHAVITILAPFRLDDCKHLLPDLEMWRHVGGSLGEGAVLDEGLAKAAGEVLVAGKCHSPGGPRPESYVRVAVLRDDGGPIVDKRITVFGDRRWSMGSSTAPVPFSEMPLDWSRAFGGEGYASNPKGRGAGSSKHDGSSARWLPNLEDPQRLVASPSDNPAPKTFLPFDVTWPQRLKKQGTNYGAQWLNERFPGPADDLDPTFYNLADDDQRIRGYFQGGERFVLANMHPEHAHIEGELPRLVGRSFIARRPAGLKRPRRGRPAPEKLEEVATRIDTLWFFPDAMMGVMVFRGTTIAAEDDLSDIEQVMIAVDDAAALRPVAHFEAALAARLDKDDGAIRSIDDEDLLPPADLGYTVSFPAFEMESKLMPDMFLRKNQERAARLHREATRKSLMNEGLDPAQYGLGETDPPALDVPTYRQPKRLAQFVREQTKKAQGERVRLDAEAKAADERARALMAAQGLDWDQMKKDAAREMGPPKLTVRATLDQARADIDTAAAGELTLDQLRSFVNDGKMMEKLESVELEHRRRYRLIAHWEPEVRPPPDDVRAIRRAQAEVARDARVSLAGADLSGADLSGLDLSGVDLSGAFLEGASLAGANLRRANFSKAVLARCDLSDADLDGAILTEANLGASKLVRTTLRDVNARGAIFDRAIIEGASLSGAELDDASFLQTSMSNPDMGGISGNQTIFLQLDMSGVKLDGAKLTKTLFYETKLDGASLDGAQMPQTQIVKCSAKGLSAKGAVLNNSFIGHGSVFDGATFDGADLSFSSLRTTSLVEASFREVKLRNADLSECDAALANFERAVGPKAIMMRTSLRGAKLRGANLMEALLSKADLAEADLSHSNLFRSDLSRVHLSGGTKIDGALLDFARVDPKEKREGE